MCYQRMKHEFSVEKKKKKELGEKAINLSLSNIKQKNER